MDLAALRLSVISAVCAMLQTPYLIRVFKSDFDASLTGNWIRLLEFSLCMISNLTSGLAFCWSQNCLLHISLSGLLFSLISVIYNVLFGLMTPQVTLCNSRLSCICYETKSCRVTFANTWEVFLFSLSLCMLLVSMSVLCSMCVVTEWRQPWRKNGKIRTVSIQEKQEDTNQSEVIYGISAFDASGEVLSLDQARATDVSRRDQLALKIQVPKKDFDIVENKQGHISVVFKKKGKK